jgi:hypothetical protein
MIGAYLPAPAIGGLSDQEQALVTGLSTKLAVQSVRMLVRNAYYEGTQRLYQLGISIPPALAGIRTVVDWPRICIDPLVQRCVIDGFRLDGETDVNDELTQHWQSNDMDAEAPLCFLDSLIYGRGYMIVGSPDEPGDSPIITVESPLNMTLNWDPRTRRVTAAYQAYEVEGVYRAVLYLPDQTVSMSRDQSRGFSIDDRDVHGFGEVPVVRFPNRARSVDREGQSEITAAVMNTTDSACRTLLGMEIAREFYSIPHRYVLGASESDFVDSSGAPKAALDMAMNKFLAFERDEEGQAPTVGQFAAADPSVYTKIIDEYAQLMASYTQFPPDWFGQVAKSNPASADAIRSAQDGVNRRARQVQRQFSDPAETVQRLVWRFANGGAEVPANMKRLETEWSEVSTPTPSATADAIFKQIQAGAVPPRSDVTLSKLGYTAAERARLAQDTLADPGEAILAEVANSLLAKEARANKAIAEDLQPDVAAAPTVPTNDPTAS